MTAQTPLRPGGATPAGGGTPLTLGSLCTGYGGLDLAVAAVLPVRLAWVADNDAGASALLAHHHPGVPNLSDLSAVDFRQVQPVDVLTAGFPCQDISYAGRGAGIREGTRSGLWHTIADAISVLRPRLVVLENVRAIVSRRPGLDVVLGDLASLGFDAEWTCVRASDVGAPHQRWRWFLVATAPGNAADIIGQRAWGPGVTTQSDAPRNAGGITENTDGAACGQWRVAAPGEAPGGRAWADAGGRGGAPAADAGRHPWPQDDPHGPAPAGRGGAPADATSVGGDERRAEPAGQQRRPDAAIGGGVDWGHYAPAIARWERATGRAAPDPTEPGRDGKPRLSPLFVEWLMGLPSGHVTAVPGLSRNQMLSLLGNGVVWQQGAAALAELLEVAG